MFNKFHYTNLGLALDRTLKFYTNEAKDLKVKVRTFLGLVSTFVEVTGEKLVAGPLWPTLLSWIGSITWKQGKPGAMF